MALIIRLAFFCAVSFTLFAGYSFTHFIFSQNYDRFIEWLAALLQKDHNWIPFFKSRLTISSFQYIRMLVVIADIFLLVLVSLCVYRFNKLETTFKNFIVQCKRLIRSTVRWLKCLPDFDRYFFYLITAFVFLKAIWYSAVIPIQYDEAWTYNYYISSALWQSILLPSNNHKLFTFIAWWFNRLPFDTAFMIRLPNAIAGVMLITLFFYFARKYFNTAVSLIGLSWFATCIPVAIYMTLARSYVFVVLFSLLLLIQYFGATQTKENGFNKPSLVATIVLGYFSNPVFFFGHAIMSVYFSVQLLIGRQFQKLRSILIGNIVAVPFLLFLYSTDIIGGHFSGLIHTAFKPNANTNFFLDNIRLNAGFQTGIENTYLPFVGIIAIAIALCFSRYAQPKSLLIYAVLSIVWLPLHAVMVHDDTSSHKTIFITISVTLILMYITQFIAGKRTHNHYWIGLAALLMITVNSKNLNEHSWFTWSAEVDESVKIMSSLLIKNKASDCVIIPEYYKPGVEFYARIHHKRIKLYMLAPNSIDYEQALFVTKFPQFVLSDHREKQPFNEKKYRLVFSDKLAKLYQVKESE